MGVSEGRKWGDMEERSWKGGRLKGKGKRFRGPARKGKE